MYQEKYNINWHTYSDHLKEMLHEMMKSKELTDVTLVCDDKKQFNAHKVVLSACSSVFKSIIKDLPHNSSVIYLRGIQHQEMESILEFMYLGEATLFHERMNEFLHVAKNLEIKQICKNVKFNEETMNIDDQEILDNVDYIEDEDKLAFDIVKEENCFSTSTEDNSKLQKNSNGMFECDKCEKKFTNKSHLKRHIQSIHEGMMFQCNLCDFQSKRQDYLKTHQQSKHY